MADSKTVLITGATRGIGLELASHYTNSGWNVIAAARDLNKAVNLKALAPYKLVQIDTSDEASILAAAKQLDGETIDLLINNAGTITYEKFETTTKESLIKQFEVNAVGPFLVTRAFVPHLRAAVAKRGTALVGHLSSFLGSITYNSHDSEIHSGIYGYRTSKTALNMISSCLALDLKKDKIISVSLHPGYVNTDMTLHNASINPDKSVAGLAKVLAGIKAEDSGKFFNYDGSNMPW